MENITDKEVCNFVKAAINTLEQEKKEEVMKCVGTFVMNPRISEINKQIEQFQKQCKHIGTNNISKCPYCGKQMFEIK